MNGYFDYLLELVNMVDSNYTILLDILYRIDFRWSVHNDDNRISDAIELRYNYQVDYGVSESELKELLLVPCSVIEVICGLAIHMDEIMRDPDERHIAQLTHYLLHSLGTC